MKNSQPEGEFVESDNNETPIYNLRNTQEIYQEIQKAIHKASENPRRDASNPLSRFTHAVHDFSHWEDQPTESSTETTTVHETTEQLVYRLNIFNSYKNRNYSPELVNVIDYPNLFKLFSYLPENDFFFLLKNSFKINPYNIEDSDYEKQRKNLVGKIVHYGGTIPISKNMNLLEHSWIAMQSFVEHHELTLDRVIRISKFYDMKTIELLACTNISHFLASIEIIDREKNLVKIGSRVILASKLLDIYKNIWFDSSQKVLHGDKPDVIPILKFFMYRNPELFEFFGGTSVFLEQFKKQCENLDMSWKPYQLKEHKLSRDKREELLYYNLLALHEQNNPHIHAQFPLDYDHFIKFYSYENIPEHEARFLYHAQCQNIASRYRELVHTTMQEIGISPDWLNPMLLEGFCLRMAYASRDMYKNKFILDLTPSQVQSILYFELRGYDLFARSHHVWSNQVLSYPYVTKNKECPETSYDIALQIIEDYMDTNQTDGTQEIFNDHLFPKLESIGHSPNFIRDPLKHVSEIESLYTLFPLLEKENDRYDKIYGYGNKDNEIILTPLALAHVLGRHDSIQSILAIATSKDPTSLYKFPANIPDIQRYDLSEEFKSLYQEVLVFYKMLSKPQRSENLKSYIQQNTTQNGTLLLHPITQALKFIKEHNIEIKLSRLDQNTMNNQLRETLTHYRAFNITTDRERYLRNRQVLFEMYPPLNYRLYDCYLSEENLATSIVANDPSTIELEKNEISPKG